MKFTPSTKYKIQDSDEMQLFMHVKRRGASATKNKKAYARHGKHKGRGYNYQKEGNDMHINFKWLSLVFALLVPLGIGIAFATSDNLLLGCFLVSLGFFGYRDAEAGRLDYDARDYE